MKGKVWLTDVARVTIVNAFGETRNLGDWALTRSAIALVRSAWPHAHVGLVPWTRNADLEAWLRRELPAEPGQLSIAQPFEPTQTIAAFGSATLVERSRIIAWTVGHAVRAELRLRSSTYSTSGKLGAPSAEELIRRADVVVFRGGNLVCGRWDLRRAFHLHRQLSAVRLAQRVGVPTLILASTVALTGDAMTRWLALNPLRMATHVWAREPYTYEALTAAGLQHLSSGGDIAFSMPSAESTQRDENAVAVNTLSQAEWRSAIGRGARSYRDAIAEQTGLLSRLLARYPRVRLVLIPHEVSSAAEHSDLITLEAIATALDDRNRVQVESSVHTPADAVRRYGACSAGVGMRYHGFVFAALAGTPMVGLDPGSQKINGMAKLLCLPSVTAGRDGEDAVIGSVGDMLGWTDARRDGLHERAAGFGKETTASFTDVARGL